MLGGIGEALTIARSLGKEHIYSLAGIGRVPIDLSCQVRVGGFGGAQGLAEFIRIKGVDLLVDATHPYAAQISHNAALAARATSVAHWALRRPGWQPQTGDDWREVEDWRALMQALQPFRRPLFTLGREPFAHLGEIPNHQHWTLRALAGSAEHPRCEVIEARGPFFLDAERALFRSHETDVLVSKNSGSGATEPKLQVARERGIPVIVLKRPELAGADRLFQSPAELLEALAPA